MPPQNLTGVVMGDWPYIGSAQRIESMVNAAASTGIDIPKGATNAKSSWVQMIAATSFKYDGLHLSFIPYQPTSFDIAIGAAGYEVIFIPDIYLGSGSYSSCHHIYFPLQVPAGVRLAARTQQSSPSYDSLLSIRGIAGSQQQSLSKCDTYGFVSATTRGIDIDPGATINTKSAWVEMTSSLARKAMALIIDVGTTNPSGSYYDWLIDIGIGGAGSEVVILPNLEFRNDGGNGLITPLIMGPFMLSIPAGSRIAMRAQCSGNGSSARLLNAVIHALS